MRKHRFFSERSNLRVGSSVKLPEFEAKHARKSLRLKKDDEIVLFNGEAEFSARITLITNEMILAEITSMSKQIQNVDKKTNLYSALIKIKNFELILEKATELGATSITPFESEYSIVKSTDVDRKYERWEKIIISACKQSERVDIPILNESVKFVEIVEQAIQENDVVLFCTLENNFETKLASQLLEKFNDLEFRKVGIIIGPEGGFSKSEEQFAKESKIELVSLFKEKNILRSETAAISALSILQAFRK